MRITNDFLDMFLANAGFGNHSFEFLFGDGRKAACTSLERSSTRWPHTFMDQRFLSAFNMTSTWVENQGRIAFLTVRSVAEKANAQFVVEEIRCWSLTPLGAIPYSRQEAAEKYGLRDTCSVWNLDRDREERYCDAWDREFSLS